jgi:hypothetical protein
MQLNSLISTVLGLPMPTAVKVVLQASLLAAKAALQNNLRQVACASFRVFEGVVEQLHRANKLTTAQATQLTTASQNIVQRLAVRKPHGLYSLPCHGRE